METALVIGIVLIAAAGLFRSVRRSLMGNKTSCPCGHGCSCATERCSGNDGSANTGHRDSVLDEPELATSSDGKPSRDRLATGALG